MKWIIQNGKVTLMIKYKYYMLFCLTGLLFYGCSASNKPKRQKHIICYSGGKKILDEYSLDVDFYRNGFVSMKDLNTEAHADCVVED